MQIKKTPINKITGKYLFGKNEHFKTNKNKMADITMCDGIGCIVKRRCYRHLAVENQHRQSYFIKAPFKENGDCDYFWEYLKKETNEL